MVKSNEIDMINGKTLKKMVFFSIPIIFTSVFQLLFNTIDIIVVGRYSGSTALAGVGATSSLINLLVSLLIGISMGISVTMGKYCGARDYKNASDTVHNAIALAIISGTILLFVGIIASRPMLHLMGTPDEIIDLSVLYMKIIFLGSPAAAIYNFGAALLRSIGDTKRPLFFLIVSGILNVILNLFFVIVLKMSVDGVAIATIISQYVSAIMMISFLSKTVGYMHLNLRKIKLQKDKVISILRIGLPAGLQGIVFSISNVLIQSSINTFGKLVIAGNTAAINIEGFVYMSMNSIYQSTLSFTSQNMGAKKYHRIDKILLQGLGIVTVVGLVLGVGAYSLGNILLGIFTDNPEVIMYGLNRMKIVSATYLLCGLMDVTVGSLRGMGYSILPMIVSLTGACLFRVIWIFTIFQIYRTQESLYISYPISWALTTTAHIYCYLVIRKKLLKQNDEIKKGAIAP